MFFNIQRWSLHDGPGIRTTIFFKGCPLRCRWCSNPESWEFEKQLFISQDRCTGCGTCVEACPASSNVMTGQSLHHEKNRCLNCGKCISSCPGSAREIVGQNLSIKKILKAIERDAIFYRASAGGVTFSGGEPFAQKEVLRHLVEASCFAGIHTAVETCGFFVLNDVIDIIDKIDDVFIDLKHTNDLIHHKLTGVSNKCIIKNIRHINEMGKKFVIRIPLIKALTDTTENIDEAINICRDLENLIRIELLPYHSLGAGKYINLNLKYDNTMIAPGPERIDLILSKLRSHGLKAESSSSVNGEAMSDLAKQVQQ